MDATGNGMQRLCLLLSAVLFVEAQRAAFEMSCSTQIFRFGILSNSLMTGKGSCSESVW